MDDGRSVLAGRQRGAAAGVENSRQVSACCHDGWPGLRAAFPSKSPGSLQTATARHGITFAQPTGYAPPGDGAEKRGTPHSDPGVGSSSWLMPMERRRRANDLVGDPDLGDFADDGASGHVYVPLLPVSRAIDAGDSAACPPTDQLGHSRLNCATSGPWNAPLQAVCGPAHPATTADEVQGVDHGVKCSMTSATECSLDDAQK
jgi:hypothetical protein